MIEAGFLRHPHRVKGGLCRGDRATPRKAHIYDISAAVPPTSTASNVFLPAIKNAIVSTTYVRAKYSLPIPQKECHALHCHKLPHFSQSVYSSPEQNYVQVVGARLVKSRILRQSNMSQPLRSLIPTAKVTPNMPELRKKKKMKMFLLLRVVSRGSRSVVYYTRHRELLTKALWRHNKLSPGVGWPFSAFCASA